MIKTLTLKNFQSHSNSKLELNKGVNVISGTSDSGKTSLIRALLWIITNKPTGDSFRSHWGGDTEVTVEFSDGGFVTRGRKGKRDNYYSWHKDDQDFVAFGVNVPESIEEYLNFNSINIQNQLDAPFLLSNSPGDVAKYLNSIVDLDIIDKSHYNINSRHKQIESNIMMVESSLEDHNKELERFEDFDSVDSSLGELEKAVERYTKLTRSVNILGDICEQLEIIECEIDTCNEYIILEDRVVKCLEQEKTIKEIEKTVSTLSGINADLNDIVQYVDLEDRVTKCLELDREKDSVSLDVSVIEDIEKEITKLDKRIFIEEKVNNALETGDVFIEKKRNLEGLKETVKKVISISKNIKQAEKEMLENEEILHENMPEICPLCEQELD